MTNPPNRNSCISSGAGTDDCLETIVLAGRLAATVVECTRTQIALRKARVASLARKLPIFTVVRFRCDYFIFRNWLVTTLE
jgi:hypothetical protein